MKLVIAVMCLLPLNCISDSPSQGKGDGFPEVLSVQCNQDLIDTLNYVASLSLNEGVFIGVPVDFVCVNKTYTAFAVLEDFFDVKDECNATFFRLEKVIIPCLTTVCKVETTEKIDNMKESVKCVTKKSNNSFGKVVSVFFASLSVLVVIGLV